MDSVNILKFFSHSNDSGISTANSNLVALSGDVWRIPIPKSDVECKSEIWTFQQVVKTVDCKTTSQNQLIEKVGVIKPSDNDRFGRLYLYVDTIANGTLTIQDENGQELFDLSISNDSSIQSIAEEMKLYADIVDTSVIGNQITILIDSKHCGQVFNIKNYSGASLANVSPICCNSHNFVAEIHFPSIAGCYNLALVKCGGTTPYSLSMPIKVINDDYGTITLQYRDSDGIPNQFRIYGIQTDLPAFVEFTEQKLANGQKLRTASYLSDQKQIEIKPNKTLVMQLIDRALYSRDIYINGIKSYVNERTGNPTQFNEYGLQLKILQNTEIKTVCEFACNSSDLATVFITDTPFTERKYYLKSVSDMYYSGLDAINSVTLGTKLVKVSNIKGAISVYFILNGKLLCTKSIKSCGICEQEVTLERGDILEVQIA